MKTAQLWLKLQLQLQLKYLKEELEKQKKFDDEIARKLAKRSTDLDQIGKLDDYIISIFQEFISKSYYPSATFNGKDYHFISGGNR